MSEELQRVVVSGAKRYLLTRDVARDWLVYHLEGAQDDPATSYRVKTYKGGPGEPGHFFIRLSDRHKLWLLPGDDDDEEAGNSPNTEPLLENTLAGTVVHTAAAATTATAAAHIPCEHDSQPPSHTGYSPTPELVHVERAPPQVSQMPVLHVSEVSQISQVSQVAQVSPQVSQVVNVPVSHAVQSPQVLLPPIAALDDALPSGAVRHSSHDEAPLTHSEAWARCNETFHAFRNHLQQVALPALVFPEVDALVRQYVNVYRALLGRAVVSAVEQAAEEDLVTRMRALHATVQAINDWTLQAQSRLLTLQTEQEKDGARLRIAVGRSFDYANAFEAEEGAREDTLVKAFSDRFGDLAASTAATTLRTLENEVGALQDTHRAQLSHFKAQQAHLHKEFTSSFAELVAKRRALREESLSMDKQEAAVHSAIRADVAHVDNALEQVRGQAAVHSPKHLAQDLTQTLQDFQSFATEALRVQGETLQRERGRLDVLDVGGGALQRLETEVQRLEVRGSEAAEALAAAASEADVQKRRLEASEAEAADKRAQSDKANEEEVLRMRQQADTYIRQTQQAFSKGVGELMRRARELGSPKQEAPATPAKAQVDTATPQHSQHDTATGTEAGTGTSFSEGSPRVAGTASEAVTGTGTAETSAYDAYTPSCTASAPYTDRTPRRTPQPPLQSVDQQTHTSYASLPLPTPRAATAIRTPSDHPQREASVVSATPSVQPSVQPFVQAQSVQPFVDPLPVYETQAWGGAGEQRSAQRSVQRSVVQHGQQRAEAATQACCDMANTAVQTDDTSAPEDGVWQQAAYAQFETREAALREEERRIQQLHKDAIFAADSAERYEHERRLQERDHTESSAKLELARRELELLQTRDSDNQNLIRELTRRCDEHDYQLHDVLSERDDLEARLVRMTHDHNSLAQDNASLRQQNNSLADDLDSGRELAAREVKQTLANTDTRLQHATREAAELEATFKTNTTQLRAELADALKRAAEAESLAMELQRTTQSERTQTSIAERRVQQLEDEARDAKTAFMTEKRALHEDYTRGVDALKAANAERERLKAEAAGVRQEMEKMKAHHTKQPAHIEREKDLLKERCDAVQLAHSLQDEVAALRTQAMRQEGKMLLEMDRLRRPQQQQQQQQAADVPGYSPYTRTPSRSPSTILHPQSLSARARSRSADHTPVPLPPPGYIRLGRSASRSPAGL